MSLLRLSAIRCSWSLVAPVVALFVMIPVVHVYVTPLFPLSIKYLNSRQTVSELQVLEMNDRLKSESSSNLDQRDEFPTNPHGAVAYRGAPWKSYVGIWLSSCGSSATTVHVTETLGEKQCENNCSGNGVCNHELGECRCFHGFIGKGCEEPLLLDCNLPSTRNETYGPWVVSICPAYCDRRTTKCFCGEGTKYPNRPVPESCGFKIKPPAKPGDPILTDWNATDLANIFTTNGSAHGWCNVEPLEAYASKVKYKPECKCTYDGQWGQFCEIPTVCTCINQCSGRGYCRGGFCQCDSGYFGIDCSIPSALSVSRDWPLWIQSTLVDIQDSNAGMNIITAKRRPLIYVYELPAEFNSQLLEGRHFKLHCVNRIYDEKNRTLWFEQLYGAQMALFESILNSPHRTLNAEEADYFYVPLFDSCIIVRADDSPHFRMKDYMGLRSFFTLNFYKTVYYHIANHYPYWNKTSGRDHIWFFSWDEGACYAPKEIWNSIMLVHWGNTNTKHKGSTTGYFADNWNEIPLDKRGDHSCFDPAKDLVLPAWKRPDAGALWLKLWARPRKDRPTLFYFNGNLGRAYENGRPEDEYSMGIRQKLAEEFGSTPSKKGKLGRQYNPNVTVTPIKSSNYHIELASSLFCGVLPGDGWSGRMEDSILQGCIPVIIQDGILLPYENFIDYQNFAIRIKEDEIPNLVKILKGINETTIDFMLSNIRKLWQRFLYRDAFLLEAERQKKLFTRQDDWAVEVSKLENDDDVFSTFIQVLHYKLYNDHWRKNHAHRRESGLPSSCVPTG